MDITPLVQGYSYVGVMVVLVALIYGMWRYIQKQDERHCQEQDAFTDRYGEIAEKVADALVANRAVMEEMRRASVDSGERIVAALQEANREQRAAYAELVGALQMSDRLAQIEQRLGGLHDPGAGRTAPQTG